VTLGSPVSSTHRRFPAVCREAVFGDLRRPPQIYHGYVRTIFVTFDLLQISGPVEIIISRLELEIFTLGRG
jgi:hypothetical protein